MANSVSMALAETFKPVVSLILYPILFIGRDFNYTSLIRFVHHVSGIRSYIYMYTYQATLNPTYHVHVPFGTKPKYRLSDACLIPETKPKYHLSDACLIPETKPKYHLSDACLIPETKPKYHLSDACLIPETKPKYHLSDACLIPETKPKYHLSCACLLMDTSYILPLSCG